MKSKILFTMFVAVGLLVGCQQQEKSNPTLEVSPQNPSVIAGGSPVDFEASLSNINAPIHWSLNGMGNLDKTIGSSVRYTPPQQLSGSSTARLTATAGTLSQSISISIAAVEVNPIQPTGTLVLNITPPSNLPSLEGDVLITGTGGFSQTVKATQSLDLAVGTYTLEAKDVRRSASIVDMVYRPFLTGSNPLKVAITKDHTSTVEVVYRELQSTGRAWVVDWLSNTAKSYSNSVLGSASGAPSPSSSVATAATYLNGAALDNRWNLWVSNSNNQLVQYSATNLQVMQTIKTKAGGIGPWGIAFDKTGNLWILDYQGGRILGYAKSTLELLAGGIPEPFAIINVPGSIELFALAFDASGNLWVSDTGANRIYKFAASTLLSDPAPSIILRPTPNPYTGITFSLSSPQGIAFDQNGKLWVANHGNLTVARFDPPSVNSSPKPQLMLKVNMLSRSVSFDNAGDLWVGGSGAFKKYSVNVLSNVAGLVELTPNASITTNLDAASIIFAPVSTNLPLYQRMR